MRGASTKNLPLWIKISRPSSPCGLRLNWVPVPMWAEIGQYQGDQKIPKTFSKKRLTPVGWSAIIFLALRRYLSWIEGLTTNQNVTGSNPVRRTS